MSEASKPVQSGWGPAREWGNGKGQGVPSADGKPPTLPENHCRKKRPPKNNEKLFKDYYDEQLSYLDREDREGIFKCLGEPLPVTFRLVGPLQSGSDSADADRCDKQLRDIISADCSGDGLRLGADALQRLSWYPHQAAWQMTIGKKDIKKVAGLQGFLLQEVAAGRLVRMEAVSMIPALVLGARPGDFVLDMCAAPGSKTGMCLESVMHTRKTIDNSQVGEGSMGAVIANDPDLQRSKMMVSRTKALCSPSLVVTALPGQSFPQLMSAEAKPVMFDRVLCDVPCSGDGTLRKAPFNLKTWHISHALQYHLLQTLLLQRSIELTAIGGIIVYSTCSLNPIENEAVIAHVVSQAAGAVEICPCPSALSALKHRPGMLHWRVPDSNFPGKWYDRFDDVVAARTAKAHAREAFSRRGLIRSMFCPSKADGSLQEGEKMGTLQLGLDKCMRILPHDNDSGAFFVTLLRKTADVSFAPPLDLVGDAGAACGTSAAVACESAGNTLGPAVTHDLEPSAAAGELPKDYVDHCTRLSRMEARVLKVEPYVPLQRMAGGDEVYESLATFFGISSDFPASQLLAHNERLKTIHYVSAAARRALDAAQPSALVGGEYAQKAHEMLNVVVAGTKMFEKDESEHCPCRYRLCMDGLPFVMPYLSDKRVAQLPQDIVQQLLRTRLANCSDCPNHLQNMDSGSLVGVCEVSGTLMALWKGKNVVKLFVSAEDAASLLDRLHTL